MNTKHISELPTFVTVNWQQEPLWLKIFILLTGCGYSGSCPNISKIAAIVQMADHGVQ